LQFFTEGQTVRASIHPFPAQLAKLESVDGLADRIGQTVAEMGSESGLAVPALCAVIFRIATEAPQQDIGHGAVRALRVVASLIEENCKAMPVLDAAKQPVQ